LELLAELVRICPRGEENSVFFNCHFLQKLPRELRILLSETDMSDKRQLSAKADQIWAHNAQLHHDTVAAVAPELWVLDASVAAIQGGRFNRGGRGVQHGSGLGHGRGRAAAAGGGSGGQAGTPTPLKLARQASGLCFFHFQFGDRANSCTEPCSWQGN
jgi:hypothetical protein